MFINYHKFTSEVLNSYAIAERHRVSVDIIRYYTYVCIIDIYVCVISSTLTSKGFFFVLGILESLLHRI